MPSSLRSSSTEVRGIPCSPPVVSRMSLASARALTRRDPLPTTMATSSLSPSPAAPRRSSFSRGRSCTDSVFISAAGAIRPALQDILRLNVASFIAGCRLRCSSVPFLFPSRAPRLRPAKWIRPRGRSTPHGPRAPTASPPSSTRPPSRRSRARRTLSRQRDYRLALNYALDSRDRAQTGRKGSGHPAGRAAQRIGTATRRSHRVARSSRTAVEGRRRRARPRRALAAPRTAIADAEASLQKAGTSIQEGNYTVSQEQLAESATKLQSAMAEIETAMKARGKSRR